MLTKLGALRMLKSSGFGKTVLALFLSACCVSPAPVFRGWRCRCCKAACSHRAPSLCAARKKLSIPRSAISPILTIRLSALPPLMRFGKYNGSVVAVEADHRPHSRRRQSENGLFRRARFRAPPSSRPSLFAALEEKRHYARHDAQSRPPQIHEFDRSDGPFE